MTLTCAGCGEEFEARRSTAKWCSDRCRKAARRKAVRQGVADEAAQAATDAELAAAKAERQATVNANRALVETLEAELKKVGRLDTFEGQVALRLARATADPEATNLPGLMKDLRVARDLALAGTVKPAEDEVAQARKARERKARQAQAR